MMKEPPIFGNGLRQALYWAYSIQGVSPHEPSIHAKLIEKMDDGYLEEFHLRSINLDMSVLDTYAFAGQVRRWAEEGLSPLERNVLHAKYGDEWAVSEEGHPVKLTAVRCVGQHISSIIRKKISKSIDLVGFCVATEKKRAEIPSEYIAASHGVSVDQVEHKIHKTCKTIGAIEKKIFSRIRPEFKRRGLID